MEWRQTCGEMFVGDIYRLSAHKYNIKTEAYK